MAEETVTVGDTEVEIRETEDGFVASEAEDPSPVDEILELLDEHTVGDADYTPMKKDGRGLAVVLDPARRDWYDRSEMKVGTLFADLADAGYYPTYIGAPENDDATFHGISAGSGDVTLYFEY